MPAALKSEIAEWFLGGLEKGATHMIVVVDTFDHEDYPVYVMPEENVREIAKNYDGENMQRIMEVYDLGMDMEAQLAEHRAFHY